MDDSNNFDQDAAFRFLNNYINTFVEQDITEKVRRWYVKRVERLKGGHDSGAHTARLWYALVGFVNILIINSSRKAHKEIIL